MKKTIQFIVICIFCFTVQYSFGQTTSTGVKKKEIYRVWVKPIDKTPTIEGYLSEVGDTLVVAPRFMNQPVKQIRLDNVKHVLFKRKGKTGRSILTGTLVGIGVGALIGLISYEKCPPNSFSCVADFGPGANALGGGILGGGAGLLIGAIVGGGKIKVPIQGSQKSIQAQKKELLKYKFGD